MLKIKATLLARLATNHAATRNATHEEILASASDILRDHGAQRVRYYSLARESVPELQDGGETLFLNWHSYMTGPDAPDPGFRIPLHKATIFTSIRRGATTPVLGSGKSFPDDSVVQALELHDRSWVHIVVEDRGRRLGILSADWPGKASQLSQQQIDDLLGFGRILGSQLAGTQPAIDRELQDNLAKLPNARSVDEFLRSALELFKNACDIASLALFKFDWASSELTRHWMMGPSGLVRGLPSETFRTGEFLTGRAFSDDRYRCVLDFDRLRGQAGQLLNMASVDAHESALSHIYTVGYAVLGVREPRYLVRAINHSKNPTVPFVVVRSIMARYAQALSPYVDARVSADRSRVARDATLRVASGEGPAAINRTIAKEIAELENIEKIAVVIGRQRGAGVRPDYVWPPDHDTTLRFDHARTFLNRHATVRISRGDMLILRRQAERQGSALLGLMSRDDQNIGCYYFGSGTSVGWLLLPVSRRFPIGIGKTSVPSGSATHLLQLCDLISQAHEQAFAKWQVQGAMSALSLVGHEMTEPMAAINQIAQTAVDIATSTVVNDGVGHVSSRDSDRSELTNMMDRGLFTRWPRNVGR